jgi:2-polyprenyl-6-methoxyphenol hydroxylase-like FAD-dependent oxidoreductase
MTLCQDSPPIINSVVQGENPVTLLLEPMRFPFRGARPYVPDDYIYWVLLFRKQVVSITDEERDAFLKRPYLEQTREVTSEWHPSVRAVLELQDPKYTSSLPILSVSPKITNWEPSSRVTVLGDAVHLMSPTGGVGAITAIRDAAELGSVLAEQHLSAESIGAYERKMREYAAVYIQRSFAGGRKITNQPPFENCAEVAI